MDISALLSPEGSNGSDTPIKSSTPQLSPRARPNLAGKRTPSSLSQQVLASPPAPQDDSITSQPNAGTHVVQRQPPIAAPTGNGGARYTAPSDMRAPVAPSSEPVGSPLQPARARQSSTPGMDTLADLAAMQHRHQTPRPSAGVRGEPRTRDGQTSTPVDLRDVPRALSSRPVPGAAGQSISPKSYAAASLSESDAQIIAATAAHVSENPTDYNAHARLVDLLHKGFVGHVSPSTGPVAERDPRTYELWDDLRHARQSMDSRFALGERLLLDWVDDETLVAGTTDDRISVMELCLKAVQDEQSSAQLWARYGEYMYSLWSSAFQLAGGGADGWSDEDRLIGREVFTRDAMLGVWEQAVTATKWRINDSNVVWDRYMEILLQELGASPAQEQVRIIKDLFLDRLLWQPHATWDQTFQMFSNFVTTFENARYEEIMASTTRDARKIKDQYAHREPYELKIQRAQTAGDTAAEWAAWMEYLDWEVRGKGPFSFPRINSLYERATVRFPSDANVWEDYVELLIEHPDAGVSVLGVLERGTRHCPWSGSLWSHRLLALEAEGKAFNEIESVKHKATETGLLEVSDLEQLLQVYIAWCGFLGRSAFQAGADEDEHDIAEVGIRSALEHVRKVGERQYGQEYRGDPLFRLERIHIKFFTQLGRYDAARDIWATLVDIQGDGYDFWYRYYIYEMVVWAKIAGRDGEVDAPLPVPERATAVLRHALRRIATMDWPEPLIQMFLNHCEQHESVQDFRVAIIESRKASKAVARRREREAVEAAAVAQQPLPVPDPRSVDASEASQDGKGKRKREADATQSGQDAKKSRVGEAAASTASRDREHATVIAKNLPLDVTETDVRRFFKDCGPVNRINLFPTAGSTQSASVEFETHEDALFAQSRDARELNGRAVSIAVESSSTLWVSNYPPTADEAYIRAVFKDFGDVVDVRFPSLKFNTHRRFCYVQFLTAAQAEAATQMDGKTVDEGFNIVAKISDPSLKTGRVGPAYDGREVFVGNVDFSASDAEVSDMFSPCGRVEQVRVPRNVQGRTKGVAFVVFRTKEEACSAVSTLDGHQFRSRHLKVQISDPHAGGAKRFSTMVINSASPEPSSTNPDTNGAGHQQRPRDGSGKRERTIALLNVPDTMNDARVRALVEPYGPLRKVILRPDHQGAIVELVNVQDVGKASMGIEGYEIAPGRRIRVGTPDELKRLSAETKIDKTVGGKKPPSLMPHSHVGRPGQPNARRGGRGGLGSKRGGVGLSGSRADDGTRSASNEATDGSMAAAKSNADFKAIFLRRDQAPGST